MKFLASLALPLALAACGLSHEPPMVQPLPATFVDMPADGERPPVDLSNYWTQFNDPTLNQLVAQALTQNFTIQAAEDRVTAAAATGAAADASLLPDLTGLGEADHQKLSPIDKSFSGPSPGKFTGTASLDLTWTLPLFGRLGATTKAAAGITDAAAAERQEAQVAVAASVATVYVNLRADQERLAVLQAEHADASNITRLTSIQAGAGMASDLDVAQAQNHADALSLQIPPAELAIATDLSRLAVLEGEAAPDDSLDSAAPIPPAPRTMPVFIPADLLRLRPQIIEAEAQVETSAAGLGLATADLYPQFTLGGSLSILAGVDFLDPLTGTKLPDKVSLAEGGPGVTIPLLDWGQRYDEAKGAQANLAAAIEEYHESVVEGASAVDTAIAEITETRAELSAARKDQSSAAIAVKDAKTLYGQGLTALSDLLDAEESQEKANLAATSAAASADTAAIDLYEAVGGGSMSVATAAVPPSPAQAPARVAQPPQPQGDNVER
jgi:NodT family efflux transporter outer membrane factor (OMF) lipoprotein